VGGRPAAPGELIADGGQAIPAASFGQPVTQAEAATSGSAGPSGAAARPCGGELRAVSGTRRMHALIKPMADDPS
jgi:hypothetical protein